ncbi:MAG: hypothetical protein WCT23_09980, partial [Candidatus Neomarinimicrobiota bacterium]
MTRGETPGFAISKNKTTLTEMEGLVFSWQRPRRSTCSPKENALSLQCFGTDHFFREMHNFFCIKKLCKLSHNPVEKKQSYKSCYPV